MKSDIILAMTTAALVGCCGPADKEAEADGSAGEAGGPRREVLVSVAASLTDAFADLASAFEADHPGVRVVLNVAGSSALREQILEGAPIDVFASADLANMEPVVTSGRTSGAPRLFARNRLQIAVPPGNPAGVRGLRDFAEPELLLGLCADDVPCGAYARQALAKARVTPSLDTNEPDVRALLTKVELGELDAGITYVTDVLSADGRVDGIDILESQNVEVDYPIALLSGAPGAEAGGDFVAFVLSERGRAILRGHGFVNP